MDGYSPTQGSEDRTNWDFCGVCHNIFTLGVVHKGIAFPLGTPMLEKKGNSNSQKRIELIEQFCHLLAGVQVSCLCGEWEFIGQSWTYDLLLALQMPF